MEFLLMGKHGIYVWSAYFISLNAIFALHFYAKQRIKRLNQLFNELKNESTQ